MTAGGKITFGKCSREELVDYLKFLIDSDVPDETKDIFELMVNRDNLIGRAFVQKWEGIEGRIVPWWEGTIRRRMGNEFELDFGEGECVCMTEK